MMNLELFIGRLHGPDPLLAETRQHCLKAVRLLCLPKPHHQVGNLIGLQSSLAQLDASVVQAELFDLGQVFFRISSSLRLSRQTSRPSPKP